MILEVGKKYVGTNGKIYTIISTSRKSGAGYNVVAESADGAFCTFTKDGKLYNGTKSPVLIKEHKQKLKVQFTIDLPEQLEGLTMDEIDAYFRRGVFNDAEVICSYEN